MAKESKSFTRLKAQFAPPKRTASQVGKASRRKGIAFEQNVALTFRAVFGDGVKRGWQTRRGGDAPDIEGVPGYWVECKHHRRVNVQASFQQVEDAQADARKNGQQNGEHKPLLVHHDTGENPTLVTMKLSDFTGLLRTLQEQQQRAQKRREFREETKLSPMAAGSGFALAQPSAK